MRSANPLFQDWAAPPRVGLIYTLAACDFCANRGHSCAQQETVGSSDRFYHKYWLKARGGGEQGRDDHALAGVRDDTLSPGSVDICRTEPEARARRPTTARASDIFKKPSNGGSRLRSPFRNEYHRPFRSQNGAAHSVNCTVVRSPDTGGRCRYYVGS